MVSSYTSGTLISIVNYANYIYLKCKHMSRLFRALSNCDELGSNFSSPRGFRFADNLWVKSLYFLFAILEKIRSSGASLI